MRQVRNGISKRNLPRTVGPAMIPERYTLGVMTWRNVQALLELQGWK
jgi:hypothetical protein